MKVAALSKLDDGCCYYRIVLPIDYMPWEDTDTVKMFYPNSTDLSRKDKNLCGNIKDIEEFSPDIIFFNRNIFDKDIRWIKAQRAKGVKIIMDLDDYWEIPATHPFYSFWYKNSINKVIQETIANVDVVIVTNNQLYEVVSQINKNCHIIPNAVPFGDPHFKKEIVTKDSKMTFLYAGGSSHYQDLLILKNKFDRLGSDPYVKSNASFSLAGFNPLPTGHCQWDKMASIFKRTNSYKILNTLPIQTHMTFYDSADVVLVPLINNEFNRFKSVLKIIEAATRDLPCIVSDVLPYSELKDFPGILWENWVDNIRYCIKNPTFVVDSGKELSEKVRQKFDLRDWSKVRYEIFKAC